MANKRIVLGVIGILLVAAGFICVLFSNVDVIGTSISESKIITVKSVWWSGSGLSIGAVGSLMALIAGLIVPFCLFDSEKMSVSNSTTKRYAVLAIFMIIGAICVFSFGGQVDTQIELLKAQGFKSIQVSSPANIVGGIFFIVSAIIEFIACFVETY